MTKIKLRIACNVKMYTQSTYIWRENAVNNTKRNVISTLRRILEVILRLLTLNPFNLFDNINSAIIEDFEPF